MDSWSKARSKNFLGPEKYWKGYACHWREAPSSGRPVNFFLFVLLLANLIRCCAGWRSSPEEGRQRLTRRLATIAGIWERGDPNGLGRCLQEVNHQLHRCRWVDRHLETLHARGNVGGAFASLLCVRLGSAYSSCWHLGGIAQAVIYRCAGRRVCPSN